MRLSGKKINESKGPTLPEFTLFNDSLSIYESLYVVVVVFMLHVLCCKEDVLVVDTQILNVERDEGVVYCWRVSHFFILFHVFLQNKNKKSRTYSHGKNTVHPPSIRGFYSSGLE